MRDEYSRQGGWLSGWLSGLLWMLSGGAIAAALLVGFSTAQWGDRLRTALNSVINPPQPVAKVDVRSLVLQQVREASELTTAVFTMQAVVPTEQDATLSGFVIGKTKLLYIAYGDVKAGVDLSQLTSESVNVSGDSVQLQLPPAKILDSKIDVHRSQVYDYDRGFLGLGPDSGNNLQQLAQQEALKKIAAAACEAGLLQKASDRAKLVVTQLLSTAGYKTVAVQTQPIAADVCLNQANTLGQANNLSPVNNSSAANDLIPIDNSSPVNSSGAANNSNQTNSLSQPLDRPLNHQTQGANIEAGAP